MTNSKMYLSCFMALAFATSLSAQDKNNPAALTEVWSPVPKVVTAGQTTNPPPSDAVVLFDGRDISAWQGQDGGAVKWKVADGCVTVEPGKGTIMTKQAFGSCQLHIEWRTPSVVKGNSQGRGNSGIFLMGKYELQVLDSYNNPTYSNGQAGSIYKQLIPLVNATRKPGEWQAYDIVFMAPEFNQDSTVRRPATITVFHNGVLVQNHATLYGQTEYIGIGKYVLHGAKEPLALQDHGDLVSFRNIWIRELQ